VKGKRKGEEIKGKEEGKGEERRSVPTIKIYDHTPAVAVTQLEIGAPIKYPDWPPLFIRLSLSIYWASADTQIVDQGPSFLMR